MVAATCAVVLVVPLVTLLVTCVLVVGGSRVVDVAVVDVVVVLLVMVLLVLVLEDVRTAVAICSPRVHQFTEEAASTLTAPAPAIGRADRLICAAEPTGVAF